jgi:hypothetical protein
VGGADEIELGAGPVDGHEERQALHVVPMQVRDQRGAAERFALAADRLTPEAKPGAEVEHDRDWPSTERDAEVLPRNAGSPSTGSAWNSYSVERHVEHGVP